MKVTMIPVVTGALGSVTKGFVKGLEDLEVRERMETIYSIVDIGQNTKIPRDLRLAVTQTPGENNQLTLVWKN